MSFYRDPAEASVYCGDKSKHIPMLVCTDCKKFPCSRLTKENLATIESSAFVEKQFLGFQTRRIAMYLFKLKNGNYIDPYVGFSVDDPDFSKMTEVEEVLVINKALVPKMKLVVKPLEERARVRAALSEETTAKTDEPVKKRRGRRSKGDE